MHDRRGQLQAPVAVILRLAVAAALFAACGEVTPSPSVVPVGTAAVTPSPAAPTGAPSPPPVTQAPVATPEPTQAAGAPPCTAADLKATHGIVEGAAGSQLTEVVLVAGIACSIDAFPALGLRDAAGTALVGSPSAGPGRIDLVAGSGYTSAVRLANWCVADPAFPVTLEIRLGDQELPVTGSSFPTEGDPPACNGGGGPILEGGPWTLSP